MLEPKSQVELFSIGYGTQPVEAIVEALKRHDITVLLDVRSVPISTHKQVWSRSRLKPELERLGIRYVYMGKSLGGKPKEEKYRRDGAVDYGLIQSSDSFQVGIEKLLKLGKKFKTCLLCSERNPWNCHRSKLIGDYLIGKGVYLRHILSNGKVMEQPGKPSQKTELSLLDELLED